MNFITMSLPYPVSTNRMWRHFRGMTVLSKEGKEYKKMVATIAASVSPYSAPVRVAYTLRPKLNKDGSERKTRIDLGNAEKVVSDALQGIAFVDDKQIVDLRVTLGEAIQGGGIDVVVCEA